MTHLNSLLAKKVILIKDTFPSKEIRLHQQIIVGTESYFHAIVRYKSLYFMYFVTIHANDIYIINSKPSCM